MEEKIEGIFCKEKLARIGTGHTARKTLQKTYWYVEEKSGLFSCWLLSINGEKVGVPETCQAEEFVTSFFPEFSYPQPKELTEQDIECIRSFFKMQITYKEEENAKKLIMALIELQNHIPIDIGVFLLEIGALFRKGTLYEVALFCYSHAQELGLDTATLYFNMARVYLDMGKYKECIQHLKEAKQRLTGSSNAIKQLAEYLQKNNLVPSESQHDIDDILSVK